MAAREHPLHLPPYTPERLAARKQELEARYGGDAGATTEHLLAWQLINLISVIEDLRAKLPPEVQE